MASVGTAPNDSSDDPSGTETKATEIEDPKDEGVKDCESVGSVATVLDDYNQALAKIQDLKKSRKTLTAQYSRAVRARDDNLRKVSHLRENNKTVTDGTKKRHKTDLSDLKAQFKREKAELVEEQKTELRTKDAEKQELRKIVRIYEKSEKKDRLEIAKLQAVLTKDRALLSDCRGDFTECRRREDALTGLNKELNSDIKKLRKKNQDDQTAKFGHDEKMLGMQLDRERFAYERERGKRTSKEESDQPALAAKNAHTMLTHSLRKQTKDDDVVRREVAKNKKDIAQSQNVGAIAAGLRSKQMQINNGQFNAHLSLDAVSTLVIYFYK